MKLHLDPHQVVNIYGLLKSSNDDRFRGIIEQIERELIAVLSRPYFEAKINEINAIGQMSGSLTISDRYDSTQSWSSGSHALFVAPYHQRCETTGGREF